MSFVIGQSDNFGLGFKTLNRKPLYVHLQLITCLLWRGLALGQNGPNIKTENVEQIVSKEMYF